MNEILAIQTLGDLSVRRGNSRMELRSKKMAALLVILAINQDEVVQRKHITELLWTHSDRYRARHSLSQALYNLRKRFPEIDIAAERDGLRLDGSTVKVDVAGFRRAIAMQEFDEAVNLYSGEFLRGFWIEGAPRFERWLENRRSGLQRDAHKALCALLRYAERAGHWERVEAISERALHLDPYDEDVHAARIRAISALGDVRRAQQELDEVFECFRRELDRAPGAGLVAARSDLELRLNGMEPDLDEDQWRAPFVGREDQFRVLRERWVDVQQGSGCTVIVVGEAGVGKTRLCDRFLRLAAIQGGRVLQGRCYPAETRVPYSGIIDALADGLQPTDLDDLSPAWVAVVAGILPEVALPDSPAGAQLTTEGEGARRRTFEAIARVLHHVSEAQPVVVFIDDLQWADESTAALVHYLGRRLTNGRAMIVLALREEDLAVKSEATSILHASLMERHIHRIDIGELGDRASRELLGAYLEHSSLHIPEAVHDQIHRQAAGRPFFLLEILRALENGEIDSSSWEEVRPPLQRAVLLPASVEEFLMERVRGLDESATNVIESLAVVGKESSPELIQQVGGLDVAEFVNGLETLVRRRFVKETSSTITFSHHLIREAVYRSMSALRRGMMHGRAAATLGESGRRQPGVLAVHYDLAGNTSAAFDCALEAAAIRSKLHALRECEFFLRMALTNAQDDEQRFVVQERLARLLYRLRRYVEANRFFSALEETYRTTGNQTALLTVEANRISILFKQGATPLQQHVTRLHQLIDRAEREGDQEQLGFILCLLAKIAHVAGEKDLVLSLIPRLVSNASKVADPRSAAYSAYVAAAMCGFYRDVFEAAGYGAEALQRAGNADDPGGMILALATAGFTAVQTGELKQATTYFESALDIANTKAIEEYNHLLTNNFGVTLLERGEYGRARELLHRSRRVAEEANARHEFEVIHQNLAILNFETEQFEQARLYAKKIGANDLPSAQWWSPIVGWTILGLCALRRGNFAEAKRYRRDVLLRLEEHDFWVSDMSYAETFLARMAEMDGKTDEAISRLERAIAAYENRDALCRARLQLERTRLLCEVDPVEAHRSADALRNRAAEMGARPIVEKTDRLLTRLATRSRPTPE